MGRYKYITILGKKIKEQQYLLCIFHAKERLSQWVSSTVMKQH